MRMGISLGMVQKIHIPCPACNSTPHVPNCPALAIEQIQASTRNMECPKCKANRVGLNVDDFFECRGCKTQFTSSQAYDSKDPELTFIFDSRNDKAIRVAVMVREGAGDFPRDEALKVAKQYLKQYLEDKNAS